MVTDYNPLIFLFINLSAALGNLAAVPKLDLYHIKQFLKIPIT